MERLEVKICCGEKTWGRKDRGGKNLDGKNLEQKRPMREKNRGGKKPWEKISGKKKRLGVKKTVWIITRV